MDPKYKVQRASLKEYLHNGDFRHDLWRIWAPVAIVGALALYACWSDIMLVFS